MPRPRPRRALALALSLAAHAALVPLLWRLPGGPDHAGPGLDTSVEDRPLQLSLSFSGRPRPAPPVPRPAPEPEEAPPELTARLVDPPPEAAVALPTPASGSGPGVPTPTPAGGVGAPGARRAGLFAAPAGARSVVYVLDRSQSMWSSGALNAARAELLAALRALPPGARFQVIAYNRQAEPLSVGGRGDLLPADPETVAVAARALLELEPGGGTDHGKALRAGLLLRPDALFFVTDAADLSPAEVAAATRLNGGRTAVHVVELAPGQAPPGAPPRRLAEANGGSYRRVVPEG